VTRIPESLGSEPVYAIRLAALRVRAGNELGPGELGSLDRAIQSCPETLLPDFLLLKGRALSQAAVTRNELIRATWPFMRVVAHMPEDPRAAEGLFETAVVLERMGRRDHAADLLRECMAHKGAPAQTREKARATLTRLQDAGSS